MKFKLNMLLVLILMIFSTAFTQAENIVQVQLNNDENVVQSEKNMLCTDEFNFLTGQSRTVNVYLPKSTWYMHRYKFTPKFSGELTVEFKGGSSTTSWWMGNQCASADGGDEYLKATNTARHTQTITVTAGQTIYGTVYDWHNNTGSITMIFTRARVDTPNDTENITQTQKSTSCDETYTYNTPSILTVDSNTTVNVDIPTNSWYMHRYKFTPDFSGELTVEFKGGSSTTSWLMGNQCANADGGDEYLKATNTATHTQTITVTAGQTIYGTVYDWYNAGDIALKFSRVDNKKTYEYSYGLINNIEGSYGILIKEIQNSKTTLISTIWEGIDNHILNLNVQVVGKYLYMSTRHGDTYSLLQYDISDPANPTYAGSYNTHDQPFSFHVVEHEYYPYYTYVYVTVETYISKDVYLEVLDSNKELEVIHTHWLIDNPL